MKFAVGILVLLLFAEAIGGIVDISLEDQIRGLYQANQTCHDLIERERPASNASYCERVWDTLTCWPPTQAGNVAFQPCPEYLNGFNTAEFALRNCTDNGTWFYHPILNHTWTDYTRCLLQNKIEPIPELIKKHLPYIRLMYNIGYGISLVSLVIAVIIMVSFRRLRCKRNIIHINLFISFVLRASILFMKENILVNGTGFSYDVREVDGQLDFINRGTHWQCKLFFTAFHYILATNYMWILVEGIYLNIGISAAFFSEKSGIKWFIIFGWASPLLFVVPWAIVRAMLENTYCWNTHVHPGYFWIMRGPIVFSVAVNFIIFLNIVRVLFTKLTANSHESKKFRYRRLAKSTMVLIPLFGVHYIVFIGLPDNVSEKAELVKLYFEMFFNSIQGFIVALLFCFLNHEVRKEIGKKWKRFRLRHDGGAIGTHLDTMSSYLSRARGSIISNFHPDLEHRRMSETALNGHPHKHHRRLIHRENNNTNGHVHHEQDESQPMIKQLTNTKGYFTHSSGPND